MLPLLLRRKTIPFTTHHDDDARFPEEEEIQKPQPQHRAVDDDTAMKSHKSATAQQQHQQRQQWHQQECCCGRGRMSLIGRDNKVPPSATATFSYYIHGTQYTCTVYHACKIFRPPPDFFSACAEAYCCLGGFLIPPFFLPSSSRERLSSSEKAISIIFLSWIPCSDNLSLVATVVFLKGILCPSPPSSPTSNHIGPLQWPAPLSPSSLSSPLSSWRDERNQSARTPADKLKSVEPHRALLLLSIILGRL